MRTEYVIKITKDGKDEYLRFGGKKWANEKILELKRRREERKHNFKIECAIVHYYGNSYHDHKITYHED